MNPGQIFQKVKGCVRSHANQTMDRQNMHRQTDGQTDRQTKESLYPRSSLNVVDCMMDTELNRVH